MTLSKNPDGSTGQTLIEFICFSIISFWTIGFAGAVLFQQWQRSQCAYFAFESTHARLTTRPPPKTQVQIHFQEDSNQIRGTALCGKWIEEVELPRLEAALW